MYHVHLKRRDTFCLGLLLSYSGWKEIINKEMIKHLLIYTIDTTNSLDNTSWIERNIIVDNNSRSMKVVSLRNRIRSHENIIIVFLVLSLISSIKILTNLFFFIYSGINARILHNSKPGSQKSLINCLGSISKFRKYNNLPLWIILNTFRKKFFQRIKFWIYLRYILTKPPFPNFFK